jgi:hypothetical protein
MLSQGQDALVPLGYGIRASSPERMLSQGQDALVPLGGMELGLPALSVGQVKGRMPLFRWDMELGLPALSGC